MSTKTQSAIAVSGLRKSYDHVVLDGVSLDIPAGSVFALLGPNGAGKTTTVNILTTLIPADAGEIVVAGHDLFREPHAVPAAIGVTGQFSAVDNLLTGEENLLLMADLHHLAPQNRRNRARDLLEQFGLTDVARKLAATYSGGMRRRLDLAMGLIGDPQVLFLDEPTTGLDPRSRRTVWQIIRELVSGGVTCSSPRSTSRRPTTWPARSPCSTGVRSWPRERRPNSRPAFQAATFALSWLTRRSSRRPLTLSRPPRSTRTNAHLRCPALVIWIPCGPCSIGFPPQGWTSRPSPYTRQISMMSSSPLPDTMRPPPGNGDSH